MYSQKLKLGKSSAFVKSKLRQLPLMDAEFEADFWLDPKNSRNNEQSWIGAVIEREFGALLALETIQGIPTVNDLGEILSYAMSHTFLDLGHQRPGTLYLRDRPEWEELLPHLRELGIHVVTGGDLPRCEEAAIEWIMEENKDKPLAEKIKHDIRQPFPKKEIITRNDAMMEMLDWLDALFKAGYPSARKKTYAAYDPDTVLAIHLTTDELQTILTHDKIARTKKLRPQLESLLGTDSAVKLSIHEWGMLCLSLFEFRNAAKRDEKKYLKIVGKVARFLSETLGFEPPPKLAK